MSRKRLELEKQLLDCIENKNWSKEILEEYINTISVDISNAISPINKASAPFIVSQLIRYEIAIKRMFPGISEVVEKLLDAPIEEVIIHENRK